MKNSIAVPGVITDAPLEIEGTCYEPYCRFVNKVVCEMAMNSAVSIRQQGCDPADTDFVYGDLNVRLKYIDSKRYGKDRFTVEINCRVLDELPEIPDHIRSLVREDGDWILVYEYSDSFDRLEYHIPGWINVLEQLDQRI